MTLIEKSLFIFNCVEITKKLRAQAKRNSQLNIKSNISISICVFIHNKKLMIK